MKLRKREWQNIGGKGLDRNTLEEKKTIKPATVERNNHSGEKRNIHCGEVRRGKGFHLACLGFGWKGFRFNRWKTRRVSGSIHGEFVNGWNKKRVSSLNRWMRKSLKGFTDKNVYGYWRRRVSINGRRVSSWQWRIRMISKEEEGSEMNQGKNGLGFGCLRLWKKELGIKYTEPFLFFNKSQTIAFV